MTRVLYWNIEKFTYDSKINDRINYIRTTFFNNQDEEYFPDIIVIVEVVGDKNATTGYNRLLQNPDSQHALLLLRDALNDLDEYNDTRPWYLVPPLTSGRGNYNEAVAVFYNSCTLAFTGPNMLGADQNQSVPISGNLAPTSYAQPWNEVLPDIDSGVLVSGSDFQHFKQNELASMYLMYLTNINGYASDRGALVTTFKENGNLERSIKLIAVHTSPEGVENQFNSFAARIAKGSECSPTQDEIIAIVGDFNIDSYDQNMLLHKQLLNKSNWIMYPYPGGEKKAGDARRPYCQTHLLPSYKATPFNNLRGNGGTYESTDPTHGVYPRYGYMGNTAKCSNNNIKCIAGGAIDYIFLLDGSNDIDPKNYYGTIVNPIVGSPYNCISPTDDTIDLTKGLTYPRDAGFEVCLPLPGQPSDPRYSNNKITEQGGLIDIGQGPGNTNYPLQLAFQNNFEKVRDRSDHLPLIFEF
ncbi:hypothetical protein [Candidatus Odyssella acanthamoebae]|uniref:Endonuclease/exonuclease/phosphatase domain-containing protein n=1 Tax=Candidatus Odyssella acanthamoebae TaxID=91604 RepID=A0A077ATG2_9PROT|nr:hypothetical protein [Candidatus Paracaedibacter acanthamoebae]AIK95691.1 hypothetical protein ID47_01460 [Candidatus Paracaedibacter acanthamoebae]